MRIGKEESQKNFPSKVTKNFLIEYSCLIMLMSAGQQSDSVMHMYRHSF